MNEVEEILIRFFRDIESLTGKKVTRIEIGDPEATLRIKNVLIFGSYSFLSTVLKSSSIVSRFKVDK